MDTVADKLREARALVAKGWCRNDYACRGHVCTMGAINQAYTGDPEGTPDIRAVRFIEQAIGCDSVLSWNDSQRSKKPVLAAFDKAIELAEAGQ